MIGCKKPKEISWPLMSFCGGKNHSFMMRFVFRQCVEKYFKARLHEEEIPFPKTHDLVLLLELLEAVEPLWMAYKPVVRKLTNYAANFRYPGENATLTEAKLALKNCKSLRAEMRRSLGLKK